MVLFPAPHRMAAGVSDPAYLCVAAQPLRIRHKEADTADIISVFRRNPLLDGITLSGGEPFCQCEACIELARAAHDAGLNVWAYSGYTYEELISGNKEWQNLLKEVDVLVDGPFILEKRTLECRFRGSSNQRLIDVKESLEKGCVITFE